MDLHYPMYDFISLFISLSSADDKMVAQMQFQIDKMKEENFALEAGTVGL